MEHGTQYLYRGVVYYGAMLGMVRVLNSSAINDISPSHARYQSSDGTLPCARDPGVVLEASQLQSPASASNKPMQLYPGSPRRGILSYCVGDVAPRGEIGATFATSTNTKARRSANNKLVL